MKYFLFALSITVLALLSVFLLKGFGIVGVTAGIPQPPVITPAGGEYKSGVKVRIEASGLSEIRYTTDDSAPSCSSGNIYSERISIITDTRVRAVGCGMGGQSFESSAEYTFVSGSKAGNSSSDSTEVAGMEDCTINASLCPPPAPVDGSAYEHIVPPAFGSVLGNQPMIQANHLSEGDYGIDVALLQQVLVSLDSGPKSRLLASKGNTGYFGSSTKAAVIEFQQVYHIEPALGFAGPKTLGRIRVLRGEIPSYFPQ